MLKKIFNNKIINTISIIVEWLICIILILLIVLTAFQRLSSQGSFFGYRIYTVASGSMIPTYEIGDVLLVKEVPVDELKVGDSLTYKGESYAKNKIITHQIQEIEQSEDGKYLFHTKGVANNIEDPIVSEEQLLGKVVYRFFMLSFLTKITYNVSLLFVFVIPIAILIALEIVKLVYKKENDNIDEISDSKDNES